MGGLALGGLTLGLVSIGGVSIGLAGALGGAALGLGLSVGGFAFGSIAVGVRDFWARWLGPGSLPPSCAQNPFRLIR